MKPWTYDELALLAIYYSDSRTNTIAVLEDMKQYLDSDEKEILFLTDSTIAKLWEISDADFAELELFADE